MRHNFFSLPPLSTILQRKALTCSRHCWTSSQAFRQARCLVLLRRLLPLPLCPFFPPITRRNGAVTRPHEVQIGPRLKSLCQPISASMMTLYIHDPSHLSLTTGAHKVSTTSRFQEAFRWLITFNRVLLPEPYVPQSIHSFLTVFLLLPRRIGHQPSRTMLLRN